MSKKILVVDNNPVILKLMEHFLAQEGHEVRTAVDGLVALDVLKDFRAEVIFVDLIMPKISGEKLCLIIRNMPDLQGVVLVVISAAAVEQQIDFTSFGADACIAKGPFKEVERHIRYVFEKIDSGQLGSLTAEGIIGTENVYKRIVTTELLSSKRHFEVTLNTMAEGFVELTATGLIVYANPVAAAIAGVTEEAMLAKDFLDFFGGLQYEELAECLAKLEDKPVTIGDESTFVLNERYIAMTLAPIIEDNQKAVIVLLRDVTERKKAEEEMALHRNYLEELVKQRSADLIARNAQLQAEIEERQRIAREKEALEAELMQRHKMEALGLMATGIVHDFNNILTAMLGYAEVIRFEHKDDPQTAGYVKNIIVAGNRGRELIGLIKTFSRPGDHPFIAVDLAKIIGETLMLLHPSLPGNVEVVTKIDKETPAVLGDAVQLQQVILNLCTNSVQAMRGQGGTLTVSLRQTGHGARLVKAGGDSEVLGVELSVSDTGAGIAPENMSRIFDPYFTTKSGGEGTGLGLAVVHGIVKRHEGRIDVVSEPGAGTRFTIFFPVIHPSIREDGPRAVSS